MMVVLAHLHPKNTSQHQHIPSELLVCHWQYPSQWNTPLFSPLFCGSHQTNFIANQIMHCIATQASQLDSQQGSTMAALSGVFTQIKKDWAMAKAKQEYCDKALPSNWFHKKIDYLNCPTCCHAELVYSIDVRCLKYQSSRYYVTHI